MGIVELQYLLACLAAKENLKINITICPSGMFVFKEDHVYGEMAIQTIEEVKEILDSLRFRNTNWREILFYQFCTTFMA